MSNLQYTFSDRTKRVTMAMMGIGLLAVVYALVRGIPGQRIWANVLLNSFYFMAIGLGATFYFAKKYASEAAYATAYKRVYEAISAYLPVGGVTIFIVLICGWFGLNHLYHWMDKDAYTNDAVMQHKAPYFSGAFFWARFFLFFTVWILCRNILRKRSMEEDLTGDTKLHFKNITTSAIFIVFFGFTSSVASWDWLMSLDTHWYSTLYGWYTFAGFWVSTMVMITLFCIYLQGKGHLEEMNENHYHDLGKWIFAISLLWSYLFFFQYMLIWYADIPEEVAYFHQRIDTLGYRWLLWIVFFANFAFPMLFLISRDAKRNKNYLKTLGMIILLGHWLDLYLMIMPATVGGGWNLFSPLEIGLMIGFLGMFLFVVHSALTKAALMPQKHPFIEESVHHHF